MKRAITYTLIGFSSLLIVSCRETQGNNLTSSKEFEEINTLRQAADSTDYSATDTGDPPKTGTNWRIKKK